MLTRSFGNSESKSTASTSRSLVISVEDFKSEGAGRCNASSIKDCVCWLLSEMAGPAHPVASHITTRAAQKPRSRSTDVPTVSPFDVGVSAKSTTYVVNRWKLRTSQRKAVLEGAPLMRPATARTRSSRSPGCRPGAAPRRRGRPLGHSPPAPRQPRSPCPAGGSPALRD